MSLKVIVAGAGIGGLTLAQGLHRAGIDVLVVEKDDGATRRAQGARFHVDERGDRALRECLSAEQFEMFSATVGEPSESICFLSDVGGQLKVTGNQPFTGRDGVPDAVRPGRPVSRQLLRTILLAGLEDRVRFGAGLSGYDHLADGTIRANFADGSAAGADVLVGADGIGSTVRRQYLPHAQVVDTGVRWLGGKTPFTADLLATGLADRIGGSFTLTELDGLGMILATMRFLEPPATALDRLMPGLDPSDAEDYMMWALIPSTERLGPIGSPAEMWQRARTLTADAHPTLRMIVDQAWPEQTICLEMGTSVPVPAWPASPVTLLGDAIHAMPPNRGSGANTALQDAGRLRHALVAANLGDQDLTEAIGEYEEAMRRDGFEAVSASVGGLDQFLTRG